MKWYNRDRTIMINLDYVRSYIFNQQVHHTEEVKDGTKMFYEDCLNLNYNTITLWKDEAREVFRLLSQ
jgi:hypothetical protein